MTVPFSLNNSNAIGFPTVSLLPRTTAFLPENGKIRMPFNSLSGLGESAAEKIIDVRSKYEIYSVEDLRQRTGISKAVIEILRRNGVLNGLSETNQFSMF